MAIVPQLSWPSLRCRIGWHAPLKGALWNQGYYFTRCARCGSDLVRTTFSGWEAPRGQRVVWRTRSDFDDVEPSSGLGAGPPSSHPAGRTPPPPRRRPSAMAAASAVPDFMDDPAPPPTDEVALRSPGGGRLRR